MKTFEKGQRVQILKSTNGFPQTEAQALFAGEVGTVCRLLRRDQSAWVKMDNPPPEQMRAFRADDESGRGNNIILFPEECKKVKP